VTQNPIMITSMDLKIGAIAKETGVAVGALRYYEKRGLLQSQRGSNGYRYYPATAVQQVQFIKKAQALGFSLDEIGEILTIHQRGNLPCAHVRSLLQKGDLSYNLESRVLNYSMGLPQVAVDQ